MMGMIRKDPSGVVTTGKDGSDVQVEPYMTDDGEVAFKAGGLDSLLDHPAMRKFTDAHASELREKFQKINTGESVEEDKEEEINLVEPSAQANEVITRSVTKLTSSEGEFGNITDEILGIRKANAAKPSERTANTANTANSSSCTNPNCCYSPPSSAKFCPECGVVQTKKPAFCADCGFAFSDDEKFCPECGNKR
jgi:hypothetical protein